MEEKDSNSKRKFIKKLVQTAAGAVLLPVVDTTEALAAPQETPSASPSLSPSPSRTPSISPTPSRSPSLSPSPSISRSPTPSATLTPTPTMSPSLSPTPTASSSITPSSSISPSLTPMPTPSPSSIINSIEGMLKEQGIEVGTFNPNPTSDRSFLIVITARPVTARVDIYDSSAKKVFNKNYTLRSGSNSLEVELPSGRSGFYQVMIDFDGKVVGRRLIAK